MLFQLPLPFLFLCDVYEKYTSRCARFSTFSPRDMIPARFESLEALSRYLLYDARIKGARASAISCALMAGSE